MPDRAFNPKIMYFTSRIQGGYGVSLVIREQARGLAAQGLSNIIIAASDITRESTLGKTPLIPMGLDEAGVHTAIRRHQPDIILAHTPPYYEHVASFNEFEVCKVAVDYGEPFPSFFEKPQARLEIDHRKYQAIGKYTAHISISKFIRKNSGIKNSTVLYLGADHMQSADRLQPSGLRKSLDLAPDAFVLSTLSRLGSGESRYKGYDMLQEVRARVAQRLGEDKIAFLLCGKLAPGGEAIRTELTKAGFKLLTDLDETQKKSVLSDSDLYLSASLWEGFDLPLVEAQYLSTSAAAFSTGAHPEVCPFHFMRIDELVEHIVELYHNRATLEWSAKICRTFVRDKFNWARHNRELLALLQKEQHPPLDFAVERVPVRSDKAVKKILADHLARQQQAGEVREGIIPGTYRVTYRLPRRPKISIIIPNRDLAPLLERGMHFLLSRSTYPDYEILLLENGSQQRETFELYRRLEQDRRVRLLEWKQAFNYSKINNFGVEQAEGEVVVFFNNDMEIITPDWMENMLEHALRTEIGMVGAKLYYPDNTIQHAGVILGLGGIAGHGHRYFPRSAAGYLGRLGVIQNVSAVTGACAMLRKSVFNEVGCFDENYPLAFNDVDLCLKIRQQGYRIVWTPFAELHHHESKTRGVEDTSEKQERFRKEIDYFKKKWETQLGQSDPYYNPNLTLVAEDFSLRLHD